MKNEANSVAVNFANDVAAKVKFTEAQEDVKRELIGHFEDNFKAAKSYGLSDDEATADSLKRMGDPAEIGHSFNKVHQPKIEAATILSVVVLCLIGLIALRASGWITLQMVWIVLGLALSFLVFKLPYKKLMTALASLYPIAALGLLFAQVSGVSFEGQPYLSFFGLNIKIIDFASILMAVSMPAIIEKFGQKKLAVFMVPLAILIPLFYFVVIGSTLPAILLLGGSVVAIGQSKFNSWVTLFMGTVGSLAVMLLGKKPFLSVEQLQSSMSSERHTDFVFSALAQNSIFTSSVAVVSFVIFLAQIARTTSSIKNSCLKSTAITCATLFGIEILFGITSNFGFSPMFNTGINIPFLSYGGSLMITHLFMVGVILTCVKRKSIQHFA